MASKGKKSPIVGAATFADAQMEFHAAVEDQLLAAAMLRLYFSQHSVRQAHYASLAAAGPMVANSAAQWTDWRTAGHAHENLLMIEKIEDVETILVTLRVKLPRTSVADKKIYETAAKNLIQAAHTLLINTLYNACDQQDGFKTFATTPAYIANKGTYHMITKATLYEYHDHPFATMFEAFFDLYKRRQFGASIQVPSLNTLPDTNKLTIDEFEKQMSDTNEALIKKGFTTIDGLLGHLQADQMIHYIKIAASNETLRSDYREVFKNVRSHIALKALTDHRPVDMARYKEYKKILDVSLIAADLQELPPPLAPLAAASSLRAIANSTAADIQVGRRTTTRRNAAPRATTRSDARAERIKKDAAERKCFHCNLKGHPQDKCPKQSTPATLAVAEKRKAAYMATRDIRDKERAVAREAEKLRRIALDLTLEEDSELDDSFDIQTPKNISCLLSSANHVLDLANC
jgi:hypothetical protein